MKLFKIAKKINKKYGNILGSEPPSFLAPEEEVEDDDFSEFGGGYSDWGAEPPSFLAPSEPHERDVMWEEEPSVSTSHTDLDTDELSFIKSVLGKEMGEEGQDDEYLQKLLQKIDNMLEE